jgi:hypothetical protein
MLDATLISHSLLGNAFAKRIVIQSRCSPIHAQSLEAWAAKV